MMASDLARALLLLSAVWTVLATGGLLVCCVGRGPATLLTFLAASALVAAIPRTAAPWRSPSARVQGGAHDTVEAALGLLAGFTSYPALVAAAATAGAALDLDLPAATPPFAGDVWLWVTTLLVAPWLEETLYRERLLGALRRSLGPVAALGLTSLLFALPHLRPLALVGTSLMGLMLGALMLATGSLRACIAMHAGANLAALTCGSPPLLHALRPGAAVLAGALCLALLWIQAGRRRGGRASAVLARRRPT